MNAKDSNKCPYLKWICFAVSSWQFSSFVNCHCLRHNFDFKTGFLGFNSLICVQDIQNQAIFRFLSSFSKCSCTSNCPGLTGKRSKTSVVSLKIYSARVVQLGTIWASLLYKIRLFVLSCTTPEKYSQSRALLSFVL